MEKCPLKMKPCYSKHILPVPWPFIISRFHCTTLWMVFQDKFGIYPQGSRNKPVTSNFFVSSRNFSALIQIDKLNVITVLGPQSPSRLTASRAFNFFQSSITSILFWKPCFSKIWRAEQKIKRQEPNKTHNFTTKWQPPWWSLNWKSIEYTLDNV